jgi:hypothetical protein
MEENVIRLLALVLAGANVAILCCAVALLVMMIKYLLNGRR